jgi:hypothetical protein
VQRQRLRDGRPATAQPAAQFVVEHVEHVDQRLAALIQLPALEPTDAGVDPHLAVGVVTQPARRGR